jgi:hypothetical protein
MVVLTCYVVLCWPAVLRSERGEIGTSHARQKKDLQEMAEAMKVSCAWSSSGGSSSSSSSSLRHSHAQNMAVALMYLYVWQRQQQHSLQ